MSGPLGTLYTLGAVGDLTDAQLLDRFLDRRDPAAAEAAFSALVERHGSMVLAVCRRELGDLHDAHDAFQATFLVLVSQAATIRNRESVGGWLFGIARRVSARARVEGARRRRHLTQWGNERALPIGDPEPATAEVEGPDSPLIDEVGRLPERFRAPVVLHYFEGLSTHATAQRLGCPRGTVLSRLSRARDRLRRRLERRGASPAVLIPAGDNVARWLATESVPAWLSHATARAAGSLGLAGAAVEGVVTAKVVGLSRRVARTLALSRVGAAAMLLVVAAGASIGLAATLRPVADDRPAPVMEKARGAMETKPTPAGEKTDSGRSLVVRGRVLDPGGNPVAGARILGELPRTRQDVAASIRPVGVSGPDGRFEVTIRRPVADQLWPTGMVEPSLKAVVAASASGFGPDWAAVSSANAGEPIALKLRPDDVPIEGRIVNLEGRPIPGLTVKVQSVSEFPPALLAEMRKNGGRIGDNHWFEVEYGLYPDDDRLIPPARTDSDGRFRLTGIGRDRATLLLVEGASIEKSFALILTSANRDFQPINLEASFCGARKIDGPRFTFSAAPGRVVDGIVRDRDTGKPIAGARVNNWTGQVLTTDAQGRFRFEGQPRSSFDQLSVSVAGEPYIECFTSYKDAEGFQPVHLDIALKRGVWVQGRVTDRATGRPVVAVLSYYAGSDNPHVKDYPRALFLENSAPHLPVIATDAEGRFRAAVPPGRGLLAVTAAEPRYVAAPPLDERTTGRIINPLGFQSTFTPHHAFVPIEAPDQGTLVLPAITLASGRTQRVQIVDADGRPVAGTWVYCMQGGTARGEPLSAAEFPFVHANPGKAETIAIVHEGRSLGAAVDLKGDEPDPVRLVLKPTGAVHGRLVDDDGKPRPGVSLNTRHILMNHGSEIHAEQGSPVVTGPDGRFRIKPLVAGMGYRVAVLRNNGPDVALREEGGLGSAQLTLKPGEVQEWGDVQVHAYGP
jgi:RNA polymerase sigma factor (sigma-70 family)